MKISLLRVATLSKGGKDAHESKVQFWFPWHEACQEHVVLLLPAGRDASPSQGFIPLSSMSPVPIYTPG